MRKKYAIKIANQPEYSGTLPEVFTFATTHLRVVIPNGIKSQCRKMRKGEIAEFSWNVYGGNFTIQRVE